MAIKYISTIDTFEELKDLCWSGAITKLEQVEAKGREDELMDWLDMCTSDLEDCDLVHINDLVWFGLDEDAQWADLWDSEE